LAIFGGFFAIFAVKNRLCLGIYGKNGPKMAHFCRQKSRKNVIFSRFLRFRKNRENLTCRKVVVIFARAKKVKKSRKKRDFFTFFARFLLMQSRKSRWDFRRRIPDWQAFSRKSRKSQKSPKMGKNGPKMVRESTCRRGVPGNSRLALLLPTCVHFCTFLAFLQSRANFGARKSAILCFSGDFRAAKIARFFTMVAG